MGRQRFHQLFRGRPPPAKDGRASADLGHAGGGGRPVCPISEPSPSDFLQALVPYQAVSARSKVWRVERPSSVFPY